MTNERLFQLVSPLIAGAGLFVMLLALTSRTGELNRYTWKALLAAAGLLAYAGYLTVWQNEIKGIWFSSPLTVIFGLLLSLTIPSGLFYWIWRVQVAANAEKSARTSAGGGQRVNAVSPSTKVFRSAVLVWGTLNLLGLLIAIIHAMLHKS